MKILRSRSTKVILVKQNQIPINKVANPKYFNELVKLYNFAAVNQLQDPASGNLLGINFSNGLYVTADGKEIAIENMNIEARKFTTQLEASSEHTETFYEIMKKYLLNLVEIPREDLLVPVIAVDETELISELQFAPHKLFSNTFYDQVSENLVTRASGEISNARLGIMSASFFLDYEPVDFTMLADNRLNITRKEFNIQLAPGYGASDQVFITKAPINTENHIEFLKDLERLLKE